MYTVSNKYNVQIPNKYMKIQHPSVISYQGPKLKHENVRM